MGVISWILLAWAFCRLGVVVYNFLSRPFLPPAGKVGNYPSFSVLIPARNEARTLPFLLEDLAALQIQPAEILIYDDLSTDGTAAIVQQAALKNPRIHLFSGKVLPHGWLGKNHACHRLAGVAEGRYLLFLDADVRLSADFTARLFTAIQQDPVQLLSLFPCQQMGRNATWLSVPLMNWILLTLLPVRLVRLLPYPSLAAANGQCMLFEAATYHRLLPHREMRMTPVEDIAIMHLYKQQKQKVALLLGDRDITCRMYSSLPDSIEGFSKNVFSFFGGSAWVAFLFAFITTFSAVWLYCLGGWQMLPLYLIIAGLIRVFFSVLSRQSVIVNLLLAIPQLMIFWVILCTALWRKKQRNLVWKERNISCS